MNIEQIVWALLSIPLILVLVPLTSPTRRRPWPEFRIPPAEETAASIERFRRAAERFQALELAEERIRPDRGGPGMN